MISTSLNNTPLDQVKPLTIQLVKLTAELSLKEFLTAFAVLYSKIYENVELDPDKVYTPDEVEQYIFEETHPNDCEIGGHEIRAIFLAELGTQISINFFQGKIEDIDADMIEIMWSVAANLDWFPKQPNGEYYDMYRFK